MKKAVLSFVLCPLFILGACGTSQQLGDDQQKTGIQEVKESVRGPHNRLTDRQIANRLAELATQVPKVKHATAVVAGKYAVVGIDIDKDLNRHDVGLVKHSVVQAMSKDPYGAKAVVTSDPDILQRLKNIDQQIDYGHPASGFAEELAAIVERIIPDTSSTH
ncbi:YhcN/YlaJ family sporulation lipoprotein [Camelliibacillus cellulosilyticus]|uniref:YhcN/YlaJ family sporulation lipoprotein n=1 Tax=Camelliibacillus cellulosilyticus TaxID=2174486 RepID=A0ABV9GFW6_9BACL